MILVQGTGKKIPCDNDPNHTEKCSTNKKMGLPSCFTMELFEHETYLFNIYGRPRIGKWSELVTITMLIQKPLSLSTETALK